MLKGGSYNSPPLERKPAVRKSDVCAVASGGAARTPPLACRTRATHELHHWYDPVALEMIACSQ